MAPIKKYRFFFHYRRSDRKMSIHFRNQCIPCADVQCNVPVQTKRNKRQPRLVMQGWATKVDVVADMGVIW